MGRAACRAARRSFPAPTLMGSPWAHPGSAVPGSKPDCRGHGNNRGPKSPSARGALSLPWDAGLHNSKAACCGQ